jgi:hypothetical protein
VIAQLHSAGLLAGWSGGSSPGRGCELFSTHRVQTGCGVYPASYPMGTRGSFPGGKAAGAWSWPLTSIYFRGQEHVELYLHSPNKPSWRGAQLKQRETLPLYIYIYLFIYLFISNTKTVTCYKTDPSTHNRLDYSQSLVMSPRETQCQNRWLTDWLTDRPTDRPTDQPNNHTLRFQIQHPPPSPLPIQSAASEGWQACFMFYSHPNRP